MTIVEPKGFTVYHVGPGMLKCQHIGTRIGQILLFNPHAETPDDSAIQKRIDQCCERLYEGLTHEQARRIANDLDPIEGYGA